MRARVSKIISAEIFPQIVSVLLAAALVANLAGMGRSIFFPSAVAGARIVTSKTRNSLGPARIDVNAIVAAHLFGVQDDEIAGNLPESGSSYVLNGTLALRDPERGFAIIGADGEVERFYSAGARLVGGALLREVYTDRVTLEYRGAVVTLRMRNGVGSRAVQHTLTADENGATVKRPDLPTEDADVEGYLSRNLPSGNRVAALGPMPVVADGVLLGYRLSPKRRLWSRGIEPDDLLKAIDGKPLNTIAAASDAMAALNSDGPATLTIERRGQSQTVTLDSGALTRRP